MLPASPRRSWPTSLLLGAPSLIPRGILRPFVAPAHDVSPLAHSLPLYLSTSSRHTQQTQKPKPLAPHEQSAREHNTHHHVPNSNDTVGWVGGAAGTAEKLPAQKPKPYQREKATSIPWWNFRFHKSSRILYIYNYVAACAVRDRSRGHESNPHFDSSNSSLPT